MKEKVTEEKGTEVPIVSIDETEVTELAESLSRLGVACRVVELTVEGGVTIPDGAGGYSSKYRKANFSITVHTAMDLTVAGSAKKMDTIHDTLTNYVTTRLKVQLKSLSEAG